MEQRFFVCVHCGNILTKLKDSGVPVVCCGEEMQELLPGMVDAAQEKHVPVCTADSDFVQVRVGAIDHPMLPEHHIEWIWLQTKKGSQYKRLSPGEAPLLRFALCPDDELVAVYAYCNLHGLWKD